MAQRIVFWAVPRKHLPDAGDTFALDLDHPDLLTQFPALARALHGTTIISHSTATPSPDRITVSFVVQEP